MLISGTRRYFTVQRVLFVVAVAGLAVIAVVMLSGSKSGFNSNLTHLTGLHSDQVIAAAHKGGYVSAPTSFSESAKFLIWPLLPLLGAVQSVGTGGEVKKVRRSQLLGMIGAVVATGLVIALFAVLSNKDFGYDFQGAVAFNSLTGSSATTSTAPWFAVLAGILGHNVLLSGVILATFAAWPGLGRQQPDADVPAPDEPPLPGGPHRGQRGQLLPGHRAGAGGRPGRHPPRAEAWRPGEHRHLHDERPGPGRPGRAQAAGTLGEAVAAFECSEFACQVLGAELHGSYAKLRRAEWEEYNTVVGEWEKARYLRLW